MCGPSGAAGRHEAPVVPRDRGLRSALFTLSGAQRHMTITLGEDHLPRPSHAPPSSSVPPAPHPADAGPLQVRCPRCDRRRSFAHLATPVRGTAVRPQGAGGRRAGPAHRRGHGLWGRDGLRHAGPAGPGRPRLAARRGRLHDGRLSAGGGGVPDRRTDRPGDGGRLARTARAARRHDDRAAADVPPPRPLRRTAHPAPPHPQLLVLAGLVGAARPRDPARPAARPRLALAGRPARPRAGPRARGTAPVDTDPQVRFLHACRAYLVKDWEQLVRHTDPLVDDPLLGIEAGLFGGMARVRLEMYGQAEPLLSAALMRCRSEQPQRKELRYWLARAREGTGRSAAALPCTGPCTGSIRPSWTPPPGSRRSPRGRLRRLRRPRRDHPDRHRAGDRRRPGHAGPAVRDGGARPEAVRPGPRPSPMPSFGGSGARERSGGPGPVLPRGPPMRRCWRRRSRSWSAWWVWNR